MNLVDLIGGHPADARALHDGKDWITWGALRERVAVTAAGLAHLRLGPDDRVAVVWPTSAEFVVAYLAVLAIGAVAVPLNPNSPASELERELRTVTPAAILAGGPALVNVAALHAGTPGLGTLVLEGGEGGSSWEAVSGRDRAAGAAGEAAAPLAPAPRREGDPAVLLFTSGTAGAPKAAVLSHGNLVANLHQMLAVPDEIIRADDVGLAAVPLFHIFGLNVALGLCLATGAGLVLEERFDAPATLGLVRDLEVTLLLGAPAMFAAWSELGRAGEAPPEGLTSVRRAVSGAAALPAEVAARFEDCFGVPLWQGYGLTEASPVVSTALGTGSNAAGSVGRPLPGVEVRLVDDHGQEVLEGDPGEIWVRGPNVFAGYWQDEAATAEVLTGDGWLRTGDIAVLGGSGDLYVVDRKKDLVIVSGFNVFPAEVERCVAEVPGVAEAVVIGRPHPVSGETVEVVVVASPGVDVSEAQVKAHCVTRLARYKCPTTVRFVAELPRGLTGKALRRALRDQPA